MTSSIPNTQRVPRFMGQGMIEFVDKPVPEPGGNQLLVQVRANALCGSERGQWMQGSRVTPGHEAAGVVVAAGPDTHTAIGTPGVIFLMDFCGTCRSCRHGFTNQCSAKRGDMGFNQDGGYGMYELIHENIFFPVDADLPLGDATLLLDIMGTGGHALGRAQLLHGDIESLLIAGAGPVGLGVLAMAKILWGQNFPVMLTDVAPYRLQLAEQMGGLPINVGQTTMQAGTQGHGFDTVDLAIDTSGKSAVRRDCLNVLAQRGVLVCVGHGSDLNLQVSPDLIASERAVLGSEYFRYDEIGSNLERLRAHRPYLSQIITHRYRVTEIQAAFTTFWDGATGKVVIEQ